MKIRKTEIEGCFIFEPKIHKDTRGLFFESYQKELVERETGNSYHFVQDNHVESEYGAIRGLHFQKSPFEQTKLVRSVLGKIKDVVVDLRKDRPTFGKIFSIYLSDENKLQLLIPKGCAHGYSVLSEKAIVLYKTDEFHHPESEEGILFNDSMLKIDWEVEEEKQKLSDKDLKWKPFQV